MTNTYSDNFWASIMWRSVENKIRNDHYNHNNQMATTWKQLFKRTERIINLEGLEERVQQWRLYS